MSIQVSQVKGDVVELIFNPREEDLRVGETLRIQERDSGEGLVVQVVAFRMVTYPSLIQEQLELVIGNAQPSVTRVADVFVGGPGDAAGVRRQ